MRPYCGRFQLCRQFWLSGRIGSCLIWLAITNHKDHHSKFQNQSYKMKKAIQTQIKKFFLFHQSHRPDWIHYQTHNWSTYSNLVITRIFVVFILELKALALYHTNIGVGFIRATTWRPTYLSSTRISHIQLQTLHTLQHFRVAHQSTRREVCKGNTIGGERMGPCHRRTRIIYRWLIWSHPNHKVPLAQFCEIL